jgi:SAM-dependent methyltransferase
MNEPGLDAEFLRYIGHDPVEQKKHQRFYVQFFEDCERVVDLGCGLGDFVELLVAQGIDAVGVDSDPVAVQTMRDGGIPVVGGDVFAYLRSLSSESVGGVFASHLVEHLPYDKVLELLRLSYQALRPGGTIVLTTPDPRSLYAHLEMFYLHFGHVSFYHPRLLCFFLEHVGFVDLLYDGRGSSVQPASPLLALPKLQPIRPELPVWRKGIFWRMLRAVRMVVAYVFLRPYLDLIQANFRQLDTVLRRLDLPWECYVKAVKPDPMEGSGQDEG